MSVAYSVYADPRDRRRVNLLAALASHASSQAVVPAENQLTTVLAWLLDREQDLSRSLLVEATRHDNEAQDALAGASVIGVRTAVRLPRNAGPHLYADLSLETEDSGLQVLIEVKLTAPFHIVEVAGTPHAQPDAYLVAWAGMPPGSEARVRRVGTLALLRQPVGDLSLERSEIRRLHPLTWRDISRLLDNSNLRARASGGTQGVWTDLLDHLTTLAPDPDFRNLSSTRPLVEHALDAVLTRHPLLFQSRRYSQKSDFIAWSLRPPGTNDYFWLAVTPAESRYGPARKQAGLQLSVVSPAVPEGALEDAGFPHIKDPAGYNYARRFLPHADIPATFEDAAPMIEAWLEQSIVNFNSADASPFMLFL